MMHISGLSFAAYSEPATATRSAQTHIVPESCRSGKRRAPRLSKRKEGRKSTPALLCQLESFHPDLGLDVVAADAGLSYYAFLHTCYQRAARRVLDLRADLQAWGLKRLPVSGEPRCR